MKNAFSILLLLLCLFVRVLFDVPKFSQILTTTATVKGRTKTTTPGEPRPQIVFVINYHKTGHDVTDQYALAVHGATATVSKHKTKTTPEKVLTTTFLPYKQKKNATEGEFFIRRKSRYPEAKHGGCPTKHDVPEKLLQQLTDSDSGSGSDSDSDSDSDMQLSRPTSTTKPTQIIVSVLQAPSFFCNLDDHDVFLQEKLKHVSSTYPNHDVKFVHMIRDIFSMAVSNYVFHSQNPTPEPKIMDWMFNCKPKPWVMDHIVPSDEKNEFGIRRSLITTDQINRMAALCEELVVDPHTGKPFENYFQALLTLSRYDGLRLALCEFLMMNRGDLLRMTHNVLRLRQWQQHKQRKNAANRERAVLTLKTDSDWSEENYARTLNRVTEFVLDDLEVWEDIGNETATEELEREKEQMVATVQNKALKFRENEFEKHSDHFTKGKSNDRSELREKLEQDELFAPILSNLQAVIDSALEKES